MGRDLNNVNIIGRCVRDPEIKYTQSGVAITKFSIANGQDYTKDGNKTEVTNYFDVTVFGNSAVNVEKYCNKGSQVAVEGHLKQDRWIDQTSGQNRSKVGITANSVQFLDSKPQGEQQPQTTNDPWQK